MNVERIIVETNDETGNNPVEYDWGFDPGRRLPHDR